MNEKPFIAKRLDAVVEELVKHFTDQGMDEVQARAWVRAEVREWYESPTVRPRRILDSVRKALKYGGEQQRLPK